MAEKTQQVIKNCAFFLCCGISLQCQVQYSCSVFGDHSVYTYKKFESVNKDERLFNVIKCKRAKRKLSPSFIHSFIYYGLSMQDERCGALNL